MSTYRETLIYTESEDALELEGIFIQPEDQSAHKTAIVWIHGNTSNFYAYPYVAIGRALAERGYAFFSGNTRGHDITSSMWHMKKEHPVAGGSAWEKLEDAPLDVGAWVQFALSSGKEKVVLVGHSQGAAKVTYFQAERAHPQVASIVLASPDLYGHWASVSEEARKLVSDGKGHELLPPLAGAGWYRLSAANVVSRVAALDKVYTSKTNTPALAAVQCPVLAFFGRGGDVGGQAELDTLRQNASSSAHFEDTLLDGADHVYNGYHEQVADLLSGWIQKPLAP